MHANARQTLYVITQFLVQPQTFEPEIELDEGVNPPYVLVLDEAASGDFRVGLRGNQIIYYQMTPQ